MTKSNYFTIILMIICIAAGIYISNFSGGFLAGSCSMILIFATVGKYLYKKAQRKSDASHDAIMRTWKNFLNP